MDLQKSTAPYAALTAHATQAQRSINAESDPLVKAVLYRLPEGDRLLLAAHHLVIDGVSWRIILEDLHKAYGLAQAGMPLQLPPKTNSFKDWSERIQDFANSEVLTEKAFWQTQESVQVPLLPTDFRADKHDPDSDRALRHQDCGVSAFKLSHEETEDLLTRIHHAYNTEINDILLTALARTIRRWYENPIAAVMIEGHGREPLFDDINISRTVGWFTSIYPVVLDLSGAEDLGRQIKTVKETLRNLPRKGVGYGILKYITAPEHKVGLDFHLTPQISFNYLGQFDKEVDSGLFTLASEDVGSPISQNVRQPYLIEIVGMVLRGRLELNMIYSRRHFRENTIRHILAIYKEELLAIINHARERREADLTPSDIDYDGFDMEQLNTFLDNL